IERLVCVHLEAHSVEDEELRFGSEVARVCQTGALQVRLRLLGDVSRITRVTLASQRILDVAQQRERGKTRERLEHRAARIRNQQHVALIDGLKAANRGAVETEAFLEGVTRQAMERHRR